MRRIIRRYCAGMLLVCLLGALASPSLRGNSASVQLEIKSVSSLGGSSAVNGRRQRASSAAVYLLGGMASNARGQIVVVMPFAADAQPARNFAVSGQFYE